MNALLPSKRHMAREMAVQMLYQGDLGGADARQIFATFDLMPYLYEEKAEEDEGEEGAEPRPQAEKAPYRERKHQVDEAFGYARRLVEGTLGHRDEIDQLIVQQADNWRLERMPVVDRNVLRLAVFEMLFEADVPKLVVVDEAIELAKRFGSENSSRFVNGLLDGLLKQHAFPGRLS